MQMCCYLSHNWIVVVVVDTFCLRWWWRHCASWSLFSVRSFASWSTSSTSRRLTSRWKKARLVGRCARLVASTGTRINVPLHMYTSCSFEIHLTISYGVHCHSDLDTRPAALLYLHTYTDEVHRIFAKRTERLFRVLLSDFIKAPQAAPWLVSQRYLLNFGTIRWWGRRGDCGTIDRSRWS